MKRTILILGGGIEAIEGIHVARKMGLRVVVLDINPKAPGIKFADDYIQANIYDEIDAKNASVKYTKSSPIHGVMAIAVDAAITVSHIAQALGLPGNSIETAQLATNKILMKEKFKKCGVPIPWFSPIKDLSHLKSLVMDSGKRLVMKPIDSRGARGVLRLNTLLDLKWAYEHSLSYSKNRTLMVEEWINGPQISTESVIYDGDAALCGTGDRNYNRLDELFPFVVEDGGGAPSHLSPQFDEKFNSIMIKAAKAICLKRGTIKGDLIVSGNSVIVIEVAARLSGGYFCTHTIPFVYDVDLIGAAIKIALGEQPEMKNLRKSPIQYQANRFLFLSDGTVEAVRNVEEAKKSPGVKILEIYVKKGDKVSKATDHTKRGGMVLAVGNTREEAHRRAEDAINLIKIDIK